MKGVCLSCGEEEKICAECECCVETCCDCDGGEIDHDLDDYEGCCDDV
jgi:hypothetical protein